MHGSDDRGLLPAAKVLWRAGSRHACFSSDARVSATLAPSITPKEGSSALGARRGIHTRMARVQALAKPCRARSRRGFTYHTPGRYDADVGITQRAAQTHDERRTQDERRAATRAALVEATIACLVDRGYANTTTRDIAARAGVTPGALQHHFGAKVELLVEARRRISVKIVEGMVGDRALLELPLLERSEELLDRMWLLYRGPLFQAGMELWIAARTDAQLRGKLIEVQRFGGESIAAGASLLFPEIADQANAIQLFTTVDATLRGLAVLSFVNAADADRAWPWTRANLLALGAPLRATARTR